jgi:single-strand DNA-binding protein
MNTITLVGRAGADPVVKTLPNGDSITEFRMAVKTRVKGSETQWWNITVWGESKVIDYIKKGSVFGATGIATASTYTANNGETKLSLDCKQAIIHLLPSEKGAGGDSNTEEAIMAKERSQNVDEYDPFADE